MTQPVALETHPHYLLYKEGRNVWNRWARAAFNEEQAKEYGIENIDKYTESDIKALAKKIGVNEIPVGTIDFSWCEFQDHMDFTGFIFPPHFTVDGKDIINFSNAKFYKGARFIDTVFAKRTIFNNVLFEHKAIFMKTKFKEIYFSKTKFKELTHFGEANFYDIAHFRKCTFFGETVFDKTKFIKFVGFDNSRFYSLISFSDASFNEFCSFVNSKFLFGADFSDAKFNKPPNFNGASIHPDTAFLKTKFGTKSKYINDDYNRRQEYDHFSRAWRALKLEMNKTHNRPMELKFFCYEQDARIQVNKGSRIATLLNLYKISSLYGTSIVRPVLSLGAFLIVFICIYMLIYVGWTTETDFFNKSISLSIANSVPFISYNKSIIGITADNLEHNAGLFISLQIFTLIQNIISFVLIFLVGLGLRNNLSIK